MCIRKYIVCVLYMYSICVHAYRVLYVYYTVWYYMLSAKVCKCIVCHYTLKYMYEHTYMR